MHTCPCSSSTYVRKGHEEMAIIVDVFQTRRIIYSLASQVWSLVKPNDSHDDASECLRELLQSNSTSRATGRVQKYPPDQRSRKMDGTGFCVLATSHQSLRARHVFYVVKPLCLAKHLSTRRVLVVSEPCMGLVEKLQSIRSPALDVRDVMTYAEHSSLLRWRV